jgi:hypothetical protein
LKEALKLRKKEVTGDEDAETLEEAFLSQQANTKKDQQRIEKLAKNF